jgi:hypothetical protein
VIPSVFKRDHDSSDAANLRREDLARAGSEPDQGEGARTRSVSPTPTGAAETEARLIPYDLLLRLRSYMKLRGFVLAYLAVQARREWLARRLTNLQKAGAEPDVDFWEEFQGEFSGMGLRSDLLLAGEEMLESFAEEVAQFDGLYANVAEAAQAALNPNQSAKSAEEALRHVTGMLKIGKQVAETCQEEAYKLLDVLYQTVTKIFAGEPSSPTEDRDKDIGRVEDLTPSGGADATDDSDGKHKQLSGPPGTGPDVTAHQLWRSKGAT